MTDIKKSVRKRQDGTTIDLFVTPNARTPMFPAGLNKFRNRIEIKVSSPAKDNKANIDVIKTVSKFFGKNIADVYVVAGAKNKEKTVFIKGLSVGNSVKKLEETINGL